MKKQLLVTACLLAIGMTAAHAGSHGKGKFMTFFDANDDGNVSVEEFEQASTTRFQRIDADGNGSLTQDEFNNYVQQRRQQRQQKHFQLADANGDGEVSQAEYLEAKRKRAERRFKRMDQNGDGIISQDEFSHSGKHKHAKHKGKGKRVFARLDANADGVVTQEESHAAWQRWFTRLDSNKDKVVTAAEVQQAREQRRQQH